MVFFFHRVIVREIGWLFFEGDHACVRSILLFFFLHHCVSKKRDEAALVED